MSEFWGTFQKGKHIHPEVRDLDQFENTNIIIEFDSDWVRVEKHKLIWKHFANLQDDCKKILSLFLRNKSDEQIAFELGIADKSLITKRKSRCKFYLIQCVRADPMYQDLYPYE